jgi:lysine-specific permease
MTLPLLTSPSADEAQPPVGDTIQHAMHSDLERRLETRHLSMVALGGSIGTGLFLVCGSSIVSSGPGGAIVAFFVIGVMVYFLMAGLGELATYAPIAGSYAGFAELFVDPALGFATGWNQFFLCSVMLPVEVLSSGILIKFWLPKFPSFPWEFAFFAVVFLSNAFTVRSFGEIEYWMSMVKVLTIAVFIVVGLLRIFGAVGDAAYFKNFVVGDAPFLGFPGFLAALVIAGFTYQGTEMVGMTAAEARDPDVSIPRAINTVFWRILIFYIMTILIIDCLIPYTDSSLLGASESNVAMSPFTIVFVQSGIPVAAHIINAVILSAELSAANSGTYTGSRLLYAMAKSGLAPAFLARTTRAGVPLFALVAIIVVSLAVYGLSFLSPRVYNILIGASSAGGFIAWAVISIAHIRFRRAYVARGYSPAKLVFRARLFPFGPIFVLAVSAFAVVCMCVQPIKDGDWETAVLDYAGVVIFLVIYAVYKVAKKTTIVTYERMALHGEPRRDESTTFQECRQPDGVT